MKVLLLIAILTAFATLMSGCYSVQSLEDTKRADKYLFVY
jgi:uncharacterized protein YceK